MREVEQEEEGRERKVLLLEMAAHSLPVSLIENQEERVEQVDQLAHHRY